jgi:hypothetical protein
MGQIASINRLGPWSALVSCSDGRDVPYGNQTGSYRRLWRDALLQARRDFERCERSLNTPESKSESRSCSHGTKFEGPDGSQWCVRLQR